MDNGPLVLTLPSEFLQRSLKSQRLGISIEGCQQPDNGYNTIMVPYRDDVKYVMQHKHIHTRLFSKKPHESLFIEAIITLYYVRNFVLFYFIIGVS